VITLAQARECTRGACTLRCVPARLVSSETAFADHFRRWRREAKLNQTAVAQRLHVSQQSIARWETGHARPSPALQSALADLLEIPEETLRALLAGFTVEEEPTLNVDRPPETSATTTESSEAELDRARFDQLAGLAAGEPLLGPRQAAFADLLRARLENEGGLQKCLRQF
jgi:transcriptional regulator with XRE-family HTH domain